MHHKLKLIPALAAAAVAVLILSACGTDNGSPGKSVDGAKLSFIQGTGDEFYITMQCGVEAEAKKLNVTVDTQAPAKFDPVLQKPIVESAIAAKPDAMLVAPTDVSTMQAPLEAAAKAGIKVVLVDTTVKDPSFAVSAIASDNAAGGRQAFQAIQQLNPKGGKVMVMSTDPGISTIDARISGFEEAMGKDQLIRDGKLPNAKFTYLGVQYSHNDEAQAAKLMTAALAKDPDIVGVFATNLHAAAGAGISVRQAGKTDQVKIVGFDAGPEQVKQLKDGTVQALIAQDPYQMGVDGVQQAVKALQGEEVTKNIQTDFRVLNSRNIDEAGAKYTYKSSC